MGYIDYIKTTKLCWFLTCTSNAFGSLLWYVCNVQQSNTLVSALLIQWLFLLLRFCGFWCCSMPPVRQSARQRARPAAQGRASPLILTTAATGVALRQLAATDASVARWEKYVRCSYLCVPVWQHQPTWLLNLFTKGRCTARASFLRS